MNLAFDTLDALSLGTIPRCSTSRASPPRWPPSTSGRRCRAPRRRGMRRHPIETRGGRCTSAASRRSRTRRSTHARHDRHRVRERRRRIELLGRRRRRRVRQRHRPERNGIQGSRPDRPYSVETSDRVVAGAAQRFVVDLCRGAGGLVRRGSLAYPVTSSACSSSPLARTIERTSVRRSAGVAPTVAHVRGVGAVLSMRRAGGVIAGLLILNGVESPRECHRGVRGAVGSHATCRPPRGRRGRSRVRSASRTRSSSSSNSRRITRSSSRWRVLVVVTIGTWPSRRLRRRSA